jgi:hypothetical protein
MKAFEDSFNSIIDTSLKCPLCHGPIFHGRGKAEPEVPYHQIYSCSCLALEPHYFKYDPLTTERWGKLALRKATHARNTLHRAAASEL